MPKFSDANALVGIETGDDAAVYRIDEKTAIVETVDFFSPIVDDPFTFGQIAAANAISDIYAMGARPLFALNIAGFPAKKLPLEVLHEIFRGGAEKAREAGIPILGGHTVEDDEPKYGMVVTGVIDPAKILRNVGCRAGDVLVLTKPLGTGIVSNALKKGKCPAESEKAAVLSMSTLNRSASEAAAAVGVHACTDVTGFGLVGHLKGMLQASGVAALISARDLPVLPQARDLAAAGFVPGGSQKNQSFYSPDLEVRGASDIDIAIATDAQTSGGLLLALPKSSRDALIRALQQNKAPVAAVIGEVVDGPAGRIFLDA